MVEHYTFSRGDRDSKPPAAVWKLGQFRLPHFACVFRKTLKAVGPFYLVSMPGEVKDPMQGNGKTVVDSLTLEKETSENKPLLC